MYIVRLRRPHHSLPIFFPIIEHSDNKNSTPELSLYPSSRSFPRTFRRINASFDLRRHPPPFCPTKQNGPGKTEKKKSQPPVRKQNKKKHNYTTAVYTSKYIYHTTRKPRGVHAIKFTFAGASLLNLPFATMSRMRGSGYWYFLSPQYPSMFLNCFLASPFSPDTSVRDLWIGSEVHSRNELASSAFLALFFCVLRVV